MAAGDFIRRASGIYTTPSLIGLSAAPWKFLPCENCCTASPCAACQGDTPAEYNVTLAGFVYGGLGQDCEGLNADWVITQNEVVSNCQWRDEFLYSPFDGLIITLDILASTYIRLIVYGNIGVPSIVAHFRLTTGYDGDGLWDCGLNNEDIPYQSGLSPCSDNATAVVTAL